METKQKTNQAKEVKRPKNKLLTLIVKAKELYPLSPNELNVDANTSLDDGGVGSPFGSSKKNYETVVYKNFEMTWDINVADKNVVDKDYSVELVSVTHNPKPITNPNLFNRNPLTPKPGSNKKGINGTIVHASPSPEDYTIHFQIFHNGKDPKSFHLDPKLKANV